MRLLTLAHARARLSLAVLAAVVPACRGTPPASAALPPACELVDRVSARYENCVRAHPERGPVEAVTEHRRASRALYQTMPPDRAARMCSFEIDHLRVDMAQEDCPTTLTHDEYAIMAEARAHLTPTPHAADPSHQPIVDAIAAARDAQCACTDRACVEAAKKRVDALPLEELQTESKALHDATDRILAESYDCATHPRIISPDRWAKVAP
ncbi:MAG TPA: hypothetical protein VLT45_19685 [Kofleriaceae bacterium]|nr:hypothetical protein [Kofleriaceae bacterium]